MNLPELSVRELQEKDIDPLTQYWLNTDEEFLKSLGVDINKMPAKDEWINMLTVQLNTPVKQKKSYCIIWLINDEPVGHSNINKIIFGEEAYMHLHIWHSNIRRKGLGEDFIKLTLPYYFENYCLKKLYCEPYSLNPAPNKTLAKSKFDFVKSYITTPGWLNFEQQVNLWVMTYERYRHLCLASY